MLADVALAVEVDSRAQEVSKSVPMEAVAFRPYRRIFVSYSHEDRDIITRVKRCARVASLGDQYLQDGVDLRSGEVWSEELERMIREADIFQLFWSWNAMDSDFVRQEYEYAPHSAARFVRYCLWQTLQVAGFLASRQSPGSNS